MASKLSAPCIIACITRVLIAKPLVEAFCLPGAGVIAEIAEISATQGRARTGSGGCTYAFAETLHYSICSPPDRTALRLRHDMIDRSAAADKRLAKLANEPTENADRNDPTLPMDSADPIEPIDRIEPRERMDRIESCESIDHSEPLRCATTSLSAVAPRSSYDPRTATAERAFAGR